MNRIDRLFGILTLLQSRRYVTAEKIADTFNISIRTVYRDIKALGEQGVPVSFEQPKGYFIVQGYFLPPVSFTSDEANAMLLIENLVHGFSDQSIKGHYSTALTKIKSVLGAAQKEKLETLSKATRLQLPSRIVPGYGHLSVLQNSVLSKLIVQMDYTNTKSENSSRYVEPIGLIFYAFAWHVIGWCHLRNEYRDFKVSRIRSLSLTAQPFTKQDHMEMNDYMKLLPVEY